MAGESRRTTDHDEIKKWVEEREGFPATVKRTGDAEDPGILRIDFEGYSGRDSLERISWDEFFEKFDEKHLVFLYQDQTRDGDQSRFFKFVSGEGDDEKDNKQSHKKEGKDKKDKK